MKLIDISTPKHPNTFTMVDDADFEWLNQRKWHIDNRGYVRRRQRISGKQYSIHMHLEILKPPPGMLGDHRFGNRLDYRRENLRICTPGENSMNRGPHRSRALPKGVSWHRRDQIFQAAIQVNYCKIHLGNFPTESEAEAAYKCAAIEYHGEFARKNQLEVTP